MRINELPPDESDRTLEFLFQHQLQDKFRYRHRWSVGDVLMWDNMGTIHNAVADYAPHEHRLIKRCQVMADRYFRQHALYARSEEHTSELQSLMRISYDVFCLKKKRPIT